MAVVKHERFVDSLLQSNLLEVEQREELATLQASFRDVRALAEELLRRDWLTAYQINQILQGKGAELTIGPFTLLERIGEGGMGQVFKARQRMLNRVVALKIIRRECLNNKRVIARFEREIRAAGQLNHPHIVRAYDADQANGIYYIAMELIDGQDLAKIVADEGPIKVERACEFIRQAALGLQHASERGLVHRDIKPANLLVTRAVSSDRRCSSGVIRRPLNLDERKKNNPPKPDAVLAYPFGVVKILDMGLARCTDGQALPQLTHIGSVMGTPEYIAPEQARDSHTSDIRADLYSLGCTFYFLLTSLPPFPHGTMTEKLLQHQTDEPEPIEFVRRKRISAWRGAAFADEEFLGVPRRVQDVIRKLMAKQPEDRYQTPMDLANDLQDVLARLNDGSLRAHDAAERTATQTILPTDAERAQAEDDDSTLVVPTSSGSKPRRRDWFAAKLAVALAVCGAVTLMLFVTGIGLLMARNNFMRAAPPTKDTPPANVDHDPAWKLALRKALTAQAPWEDARQELARARSVSTTDAQRNHFDDLLHKLPSPFDELDRNKFTGILPKALPEDVVGIYGFTKGNSGKPVTTVVVSSNGRWIATNEDNGVRLFDVLGSIIPHKILAHTAPVTQVAFSPDGRLLATASNDGTVRIWDTTTRLRMVSFDNHRRPLTHVAFHPDGNAVASIGRDNALRIWDPRTGAEIRKLDVPGDVAALAYASDGKTIFWAAASGAVSWTDAKAVKTGTIHRCDSKLAGLRHLALQPKGNRVLVANAQGAVAVHDWDGKTLVEKTMLQAHKQLNQLSFAPDGKTFVTVGNEPTATRWHAESLQSLKTWQNLRGVTLSAAVALDNRHLILGGPNGAVTVIRLASHDTDALKKALE